MRDVGSVGAGPAGLFAAHILARAGIDCVVFERLAESPVRARAQAGLIEQRTGRLLERHGLAGGMLARGKAIGACEFRRDGRRHIFDYAALSGATHHVYPQQPLVGDLVDALRSVGGEIQFGAAADSIQLADEPVITFGGEKVRCRFVLGCDGFHGVARAVARAHGAVEPISARGGWRSWPRPGHRASCRSMGCTETGSPVWYFSMAEVITRSLRLGP